MNKQLYFAVALLTATVAPAQPQGPGPQASATQQTQRELPDRIAQARSLLGLAAPE